MDVVVREATVEDAAGAAGVYVASAEHHHEIDPDLYRVPPTEAVVARYRERIPDDDGESVLLVAETGDRIVGSCLVRLVPPPSEASMLLPRRAAEIDVAVLPGSRGRGVGRTLMTRGEAWAADHGAELVLLDTHVGNTGAIRFYTERLAYRRVGQVLAKELGPSP